MLWACKKLLQNVCFGLIFVSMLFCCSAYAVDCASNEFKYIDANNNETCIENKFQITTTNDTDKFVFNMSAKGTFYIDWGDGNVELIDRANTTTMTEYSHDYASANEYIIKFGGLATGYNNASSYPAMSFGVIVGIGSGTERSTNNTPTKIYAIYGQLPKLFPTIGNGNTGLLQPKFADLFNGASNLVGNIPSDLFSGLSGAFVNYMFTRTFKNCRGLTGAIPENLFSGITGSLRHSMFFHTFYGCSGLNGTNIDDPDNPGMKYAIPPNLFAGISSGTSGAYYAFASTFLGCNKLSGTIPSTLFSSVSGGPVAHMFALTFYGCTRLTGAIPKKLFWGVSGTLSNNVFQDTFMNCSGLTGAIPEDLFGHVIDGVYYGISGQPKQYAFSRTFYGCTGLTGPIPENLFGRVVNNTYYGLSGNIENYSFYATFWNCKGLTQIPANLFGRVVNGVYYGVTGTSNYGLCNTFGSGGFTSIPENLFVKNVGGTWYGIVGTPKQYMFSGTFSYNNSLKGKIPDNLFAGISGVLETNAFYRTFYSCTNLGKDSVGGTSRYFIPPELFAGIDDTDYESGPMNGIFNNTGLLTSCPNNYYKMSTPFQVDWANRVACNACPTEYPDSVSGSTSIDQCYADINYYDSDKTTLLNNAQIYYDSNNVSGFGFPNYTPVKPDGAFIEWDDVNGSAIDTSGTFTGDQSFYAKWRFNCDSDKWMYFNIENNETTRMCLCNDKRTEHTLVINHGGDTYHAMLVPESEHDYTINSNTQRHLKVQMGNTIYNAYDASVLFGD
ncbi:MAG: hypothetical protein IJL05_00175 [Alphaproteobacteria bacterium]|nr:hypothetical protein [Alphaproteobacteria bacterium]